MRAFQAFIPAVLTLASAAQAQNVTAGDPATVVRALQDYGVAASLETDEAGMPVIYTKIAGVNSSVFFYGCNDSGQNCDNVAFDAWFKLNAGYTVNQANIWNQQKRYAGSYVDTNGNAHLAMDVNMAGGGLSADTFASVVDWWDVSLSDYKDHIGW